MKKLGNTHRVPMIMGSYKGHRERHGRRNKPDFLSESTAEPSYFQQPAAARVQPVDAEVVWFNESKGFGFVRLPDDAEAYLHIRELEAAGRRSVSEGTPLKVIVEENQRGRQVVQVLEVDEPAATAISREQPTEPAQGAEKPGETRGTVKWYNSEKGFGFISPSGEAKDVFIHVTALSRSGITALAEGQEVLMECEQGKKGLQVRSLRLA